MLRLQDAYVVVWYGVVDESVLDRSCADDDDQGVRTDLYGGDFSDS